MGKQENEGNVGENTCHVQYDQRRTGEYLKTFKYEGAQFYPIAVGSISYMAQEALTAVKIGKEMRHT